MSKAANLRQKLNELIDIANSVEPDLAKRLIAIGRPIKKLKDGEITSRKYLMRGLEEILADAEVWLSYCLVDLEERIIFERLLKPIEKYWYFVMFRSWFHKDDKKFEKWKEPLIQGKPPADDYNLIREITRHIIKLKKQSQEGKYKYADVLDKLIADKAMATDLMVIGSQAEVLCVQLTQNNKKYTQNKELFWEETLVYWDIKRGLFARYNPRYDEYINRLVNCTLCNTDFISQGEYRKVNLEKKCVCNQ